MKSSWRKFAIGAAVLAVVLVAANYQERWSADRWRADKHLEGSKTFKGYGCRDDCSGHRAGYEWAQRNGLRSASQCSGNSESFIEGCVAFAEGR